MTTAEATPQQRVQVMCLMYFKLRAGKYDWTPEQVEGFFAEFVETCAAAGTTTRDAVRDAALALEYPAQSAFSPKAASTGLLPTRTF